MDVISRVCWPNPTELAGIGSTSDSPTCGTADLRQPPPSSSHSVPTVAILLCTYQGAAHLEEQLVSYAKQHFQPWVLCVSDDGSLDESLQILHRFQTRMGAHRVSIKEGPRKGCAFNFLALASDPPARADYYAYSDQDDVWEADKLERAVAWLQTIAAHVPALYCSRTRIVDHQDINVRLSPLFSHAPNFANAIVQNIGGGNTMVFNEAARRLIAQTTDASRVVSHDWWTYILVAACGGAVRYDPHPSVRYRQHAKNLVGANNSWRARLMRARMLVQGRFKEWNRQNIEALQSLEHLITPENRQTLGLFTQARQATFWQRPFALQRSGVSRQTWTGHLSLFVAALVGKI